MPVPLRPSPLPLLPRRFLPSYRITRPFHPSSTNHFPKGSKPIPALLPIPSSDLNESFLKGSGPGGQKINKTSSAVQLKHLPTGIVIKSQATRSRSQNRKIARRLLAEKLEELEVGEESRKARREERERTTKMRAGKKSRRKYRALEEAKGVVSVGVEEDREDDEEGDDDGEADEEAKEAKEPDGARLSLRETGRPWTRDQSSALQTP